MESLTFLQVFKSLYTIFLLLLSAKWNSKFLCQDYFLWLFFLLPLNGAKWNREKGKVSKRNVAVMWWFFLFTGFSIAVRIGEWRCSRRLRQLHEFHHVVVDRLRALIYDLVDCRFFVARTRHDVLVVGGNVTAQHRGCFFWLKC